MNQAKKQRPFNLGGMVCFVIAIYLIYYILLRDNVLPFSIDAVLASIHHWFRHWHVFGIGFLPIYVALMIFGTGMLGLYIGSAIQRWVARIFYNKSVSR